MSAAYHYDHHNEPLDDHIIRSSDFLEGIVEELYGDSPLDAKKLEHCLEELLALHDMSLPSKPLGVRSAKYR